MTRRKRWVVRTIASGVLLALFAGIALGGPLLARRIVEHQVRKSTGLFVQVGRVRAGVRPLFLQLDDVRLRNPPEYGAGEAMVVRELRVEMPWSSVWQREPTWSLIRIDVPSIVIVRTPDGAFNWQRIRELANVPPTPPRNDRTPLSASSVWTPKVDSSTRQIGTEPSRAAETLGDGAPSLRVAQLSVKVGHVEVWEHRADEAEPRIRRLALDFDHTITNVSDLHLVSAELAGMVMIRAAPLLVAEAVSEVAAGSAAKTFEKLERKAVRLLRQFGIESLTNLLERGDVDLRKAWPGLF